ncbi:MAG: hypothetical protein MK165_15440 [Pirellulaceae bacterium]|nr:hypothetical protein [Pirellulaceae bacterium]
MSQSPLNPYDSTRVPPVASPFPPERSLPGKVLAPAIALIVVGILDGLYGLLNMFTHLTGSAQNFEIPPGMEDNELMQQLAENMGSQSPLVGILTSVAMLVLSLVIAGGGLQMLRLKMYPWAFAASIASMLPCVTCLGCCGVGQGIGIWALVVLCSADVKRLFA